MCIIIATTLEVFLLIQQVIVLVCQAELNVSSGKIQQADLCLVFTQGNVVPLFYFIIAN